MLSPEVGKACSTISLAMSAGVFLLLALVVTASSLTPSFTPSEERTIFVLAPLLTKGISKILILLGGGASSFLKAGPPMQEIITLLPSAFAVGEFGSRPIAEIF